jgi:F-type H+-transporting ATPase subunit O
MPVHGIAGRYAAALYMAGSKAKKLDVIDKDLAKISETAVTSDAFRAMMKDPSIPKGPKMDALGTVLSKLGVNELTTNFFSLLNDNNRLGEFMKITTTFEELVAASRGEVMATITTAEPIASSEIEEIKSSLGSLLAKGQKLLMQQKVDPAIIGGFVVDIGDKHMDLSIASRIKKVQQMVLQNV